MYRDSFRWTTLAKYSELRNGYFSRATTVNAVVDPLFLQNPISVLLFSCNATRQLVERIREREYSNSYMQSTLTHGDDGAMQFVTSEDKVLQKS
jgi:hypothetical protein